MTSASSRAVRTSRSPSWMFASVKSPRAGSGRRPRRGVSGCRRTWGASSRASGRNPEPDSITSPGSPRQRHNPPRHRGLPRRDAPRRPSSAHGEPRKRPKPSNWQGSAARPLIRNPPDPHWVRSVFFRAPPRSSPFGFARDARGPRSPIGEGWASCAGAAARPRGDGYGWKFGGSFPGDGRSVGFAIRRGGAGGLGAAGAAVRLRHLAGEQGQDAIHRRERDEFRVGADRLLPLLGRHRGDPLLVGGLGNGHRNGHRNGLGLGLGGRGGGLGELGGFAGEGRVAPFGLRLPGRGRRRRRGRGGGLPMATAGDGVGAVVAGAATAGAELVARPFEPARAVALVAADRGQVARRVGAEAVDGVGTLAGVDRDQCRLIQAAQAIDLGGGPRRDAPRRRRRWGSAPCGTRRGCRAGRVPAPAGPRPSPAPRRGRGRGPPSGRSASRNPAWWRRASARRWRARPTGPRPAPRRRCDGRRPSGGGRGGPAESGRSASCCWQRPTRTLLTAIWWTRWTSKAS